MIISSAILRNQSMIQYAKGAKNCKRQENENFNKQTKYSQELKRFE
jgi:hypothetical protein